MWNKGRVFLVVASMLTGFGLTTKGSLFLVTAYADTAGIDPNQQVGISLSQAKVFANAQYIGNIAPGDSETDKLVITNTGSQSELLLIRHTLTGDIFLDNGKIGTQLGTGTNPEDGQIHGISMDYGTKYGTSPSAEFDDHPLQISYQIDVSGLQGGVVPIVEGPFSTDEVSPSFTVGAGQTATVTYTYQMPIVAHNDYQGTQGVMGIEIDASANSTPPTTPPGPPNPPVTPPTTPPVTPPAPPSPPNPPVIPPVSPNPPTPPSTGGHTTPVSQTHHHTGKHTKPVATPTVVTGGTSPVTGLPVGVMVAESTALFALGLGFLLLWRKQKRE